VLVACSITVHATAAAAAAVDQVQATVPGQGGEVGLWHCSQQSHMLLTMVVEAGMQQVASNLLLITASVVFKTKFQDKVCRVCKTD
jgi:hypothetical protein